MLWFVFALIATFGWGFADLFYKKGTDSEDRYSHLKISVCVGLVMGIVAFVLIPFSETGITVTKIPVLFLKYSPASLSYIISMIIGYAGLRYLELSIISPIQNASGALSTVCMAVYFIITGRISNIFDEFSVFDITGTFLIAVGMIALAFVEKKIAREETAFFTETQKKKYKFGALALIFPILYCVFDTIGTAADGIILDEEAGLGLGEIDVLIIYGLTFFVIGIFSWIVIYAKTKTKFNPFKEKYKLIAAIFEEAGQVFYVFAMADEPILAAPMIASYCVLSVLLSRTFIKEKMRPSQYLCVFFVICGIILLGISEGLS